MNDSKPREQSSSRASPSPSPPNAWPRLQGSTGDARVMVVLEIPNTCANPDFWKGRVYLQETGACGLN